jgi:tetratricopeptide (TPR) repeat protein
VVTGRLLPQHDSFSIQVELVDTRDTSLLWGQQYNRKMSEIVSLQEDIARAIINALDFRLTGEEENRMSKRPTESKEAYEAFLRGRFYFDKFTQQDVLKALEYFQQAVEIDPNYTLAHSWIGWSYFMLAQPLGGISRHEGWQKARLAALRAIEIDDTQAEAHALLGSAHLWYDWDWEKARKELERAVQLNPNIPASHWNFSWYLAAMGRHEEAVASAKRSVELSPVNAQVKNILAEILGLARRYDEGIAVCREILELDPGFRRTYADLRWLYEYKEDYEEAIETYKKAHELPGGNPERAESLRQAYEQSGKEGYWRWWLDHMTESRKPGQACEGCIEPYIVLGEFDQAFVELERAFENRDGDLILLQVDPHYDPLRDDPRFQDLLRRLNFPP